VQLGARLDSRKKFHLLGGRHRHVAGLRLRPRPRTLGRKARRRALRSVLCTGNTDVPALVDRQTCGLICCFRAPPVGDWDAECRIIPLELKFAEATVIATWFPREENALSYFQVDVLVPGGTHGALYRRGKRIHVTIITRDHAPWRVIVTRHTAWWTTENTVRPPDLRVLSTVLVFSMVEMISTGSRFNFLSCRHFDFG